MESLPDHVWIKILKIGTETGRLDHTDICALAITNSHFDVLTHDNSLWATLICRDFPGSLRSFQVPSKALYRELLERERKYEFEMKVLHALLSFVEVIELQTHDDWADPFLDVQLDETSFGSSSQHNTAQINSEFLDWNPFDSIIGDDMGVLPLPDEDAPALFNANHPSLREARNHHYKKKPSKRFDKASRPKVIPMSKAYIPMNRPPRRSMPRKI